MLDTAVDTGEGGRMLRLSGLVELCPAQGRRLPARQGLYLGVIHLYLTYFPKAFGEASGKSHWVIIVP